eukprot:TRINITY_DN53924_c0_g1_i1.p1 TRINITY_DN53924_c0_g1~~TRINITY_DN53924_c0_g1_i1.p1  ORF type:complete len:150 (-),score=34.29 TRINITY_DN53924_c0_g1_i1:168-617(-)
MGARSPDRSAIISEVLAQESQMLQLLAERVTVRRFIAAAGDEIEGVPADLWSPVLQARQERSELQHELDQVCFQLRNEQAQSTALAQRCAALQHQVIEMAETIATRAHFPASPPPLIDSLKAAAFSGEPLPGRVQRVSSRRSQPLQKFC